MYVEKCLYGCPLGSLHFVKVRLLKEFPLLNHFHTPFKDASHSEFEILNKGYEPTCFTARRSEVIDITCNIQKP